MSKNQAYNKYKEKLYAIRNIENLSEDEVKTLFTELLFVLPNNGKLYKYKSLANFHIEELTEKYVWFSSAKYLNDNKDCAFNVDVLKETEKLLKYFLKDNNFRKTLVKGSYMELAKKCPNITQEDVKKCFDCICKNSNKIGKLKFNSFCKKYKLTNEQKQKLVNSIEYYREERQCEKYIGKSICNLSDLMEKTRNSARIWSLTNSHTKDSMWAYYCNNKGICIEYDFSKINSYEIQKAFIDTQKVKYGRKKKFSFVDIVEAELVGDEDLSNKVDKMIMDQVIAKEKSWSNEEEWRVILNANEESKGLKVFIDIVSAIYIDYSIINDEKIKQIIDIAKQNGWRIFVRYFDRFKSEYQYDTIEKTNKYIDKMKSF